MTSETIFRPLTKADLLAFTNGKLLDRSVRGFAAEQDGKLLGVFGVSFEAGRLVAFSEMTPEAGKKKKTIIRGSRILLNLLAEYKRPVYAVPDKNKPTAMYFLVKLGWKPTGQFSPEGDEIFVRG